MGVYAIKCAQENGDLGRVVFVDDIINGPARDREYAGGFGLVRRKAIKAHAPVRKQPLLDRPIKQQGRSIVPGILSNAMIRSADCLVWAFQNLQEASINVQQHSRDIVTQIVAARYGENLPKLRAAWRAGRGAHIHQLVHYRIRFRVPRSSQVIVKVI